MSSDAQTRVTEALSGRYRVERELGRGGMATVYLAEDVRLGRRVAVKVLRPELAAALGPDRFAREITIAAGLQHPHIVPLFESGESQGLLYYVMPFVEGETLRQRLSRTGPLTLDETSRITREVALALSHAHAQGLIHRDIKPENILLSGGTAVVTDFGIAKAISAAGGDRMTQTGVAIGTPEYMSPEQASSVDQIDARSDVYSLGCVTYEMLVGEPPFRGPSAMAVLARHSLDPVPSVRTVRSAIPTAVQGVLEKAMAKVPADRYESALDFADALARASTGPVTVEVAAPTVAGREGRRRWLLVAGALVLLAAVAGYFGLRPVRPDADATPMIAVLPLENLGTPDDQHFADGLTDEITSRIGSINGIGTISRASAAHFAGRDRSLREVGKELGVGYVLTGSVQTERRADGSGEVRVVPHLVQVSDGHDLWSQSYTVALAPGEIFKVQASIAEQVASQLNVRLVGSERATRQTAVTHDMSAYEAFLRGEALDNQRYAEGPMRQAIAEFSRATTLDPTFLDAFAKLGELQSMYYYLFDRSPERQRLASEAVDHALALDSTAAEARLARGYLFYWVQGDFARALVEFSEAKSAQPNNSELLWLIGSVIRRRGQVEQSLDYAKRAAQLDPLSPAYAMEVGATEQMLRRYDAAEESYRRAASLAPGFVAAYHSLSHLAMVRNGDTAKAHEAMHEAVAHSDTTALFVALIPRLRWHLAFLDRSLGSAFERLSLAKLPVDSAAFYLAKGEYYRWKGQLDRARPYFDSARAVLVPRHEVYQGSPAYHADLGLVYAVEGDSVHARQEGQAAMTIQPVARDAVQGVAWIVQEAEIDLILGDRADAIDQLRAVLSVPSTLSPAWFRAHPAFAAIRDDPRLDVPFQASATR
jgi:eukaryotic-like serine/threonine-protein kinase